jgi:hypothetical protein
MLKRMCAAVCVLATVACGAGSSGTPTAPSAPSSPTQVAFSASAQLGGVNVADNVFYSFCKPDISGNDLCTSTSTNPSGGQAPYHFQLGSGVGFPPSGIVLNQNGTLTGTPTVAGASTFSVCAVDLAGRSACSTVTLTIGPRPAPIGTVTVGHVSWSCTISAAPLPGWRNCTGTVALAITKTISSGYVSVFFNYPDDGSFFHGDLPVGSGTPGNVIVNVANPYVSHCANGFTTTVDVYNGTQSAQSPPLLTSVPVTLTGC